ncbi:MAG: Arc family DNA-binding protein [Rhizobiales bacterium]|nr:Arc family DNA-binding protein [Hyphomicrobiales bacterium]
MSNDPVHEQDKFMLRLPEGMRDRIKLQAERNNRSMNAEIVATLEIAYPADKFDEALFMVQFVRPILDAGFSKKHKEERHTLLKKANDYLSQFEEVDYRLSLIYVDQQGERLIFLRPPTKEQSEADLAATEDDSERQPARDSDYWRTFGEALPTPSEKKAKKENDPH